MKFKIIVMAFIITFAIVLVVFGYLWSRQKKSNHLADVLGGINPEDSSNEQLQSLKMRDIIKRFSIHFESSSWANRQEELLIQAGIPFRGSEFMVISLAVAAITAFLMLVLTRAWGVTIIGGIVAFYIPTIIVKLKISKKRNLLNGQLPMALTLMANSMRSGYSYMQAIDLVAHEVDAPLGEEFGLVLKEINLGITTEEAFTNLVKRVNTPDLDLTVTAFLIQRQVGGNLAELLDNIAKTISERMKMREKVSALTAQGKISGLILSLLPVFLGIMIYMTNSGYIMPFLHHPLGKFIIGVGVMLQLLGIWWMNKIITIDM